MGTGKWRIGDRAALAGADRSERRAACRADTRLLALAFLAGILLITRLGHLPSLWLFTPALLLGVRRNPARSYALALVLGALWTTLLSMHQLGQRLPVDADDTVMSLVGQVTGLPETDHGRTRFLFASDARPQRTRVSWYDQHPALHPGDCWRLTMKLHAPHGSLNPGGFDYESWLWRSRIGATGYVRAARRCSADKADPVDRWRQSIASKINNTLAGHPMSGVIRALSVGERSGISNTQWQVLRHTGTSHLVAISGLHIGLLAGLIWWLVRWLSPRVPGGKRVPAVVTAAAASAFAAGAYAALAGFALPTQRALLMLAVVLGAIVLRRRSTPGDLLALAALAVLVLDPFAVLAPGFWLSFGAVAWILYLMRGRVGTRRWTAWLGLQPALVLALAPLTLFWFGEASLAAPLANAILIPAFVVVVPAVLFAVALMLISPAVGAPVLHCVADGLNLGWSGLQLLAQLPAAHFALPQPGVFTLILALAGVVLLLAPRGIPGRGLGIIALLPLLIPPAAPPINGFRLTLLDVGQGLSAVVRTAHHILLFDAGPRFPTGFDAGEVLVLPYLRSQGIHRLDRLIISHGDIDHRGGAAAVRSGIPVLLNAGAGTTKPCRAGQRWRWDGVTFELLHPDAGDWRGNDSSCVLRISGPGGSLLLTGDIEAAAEQHLLGTHNIQADVLVVPHHGSATSSTPEFIRAVHPSYALVPAGWHNRWSFPRPPVVARYQAAGARMLQTGKRGAIRIEFDPSAGVTPPKSWRQRRKHFWSVP